MKAYKDMTTEELKEEIQKRTTMPTDPELQEAVKYLIENGMKEAEAIGFINTSAKRHMKK